MLANADPVMPHGPGLLKLQHGREGAGHNVMPRPLLLERDAETLAFFARQLGLAA